MNMEKLRRAWDEDRTVLTIFLTIPSSETAELVAHAGWEVVTIDMQHSMADFRQTLEMLYAMSSTSAVPFVRLPWNDPAIAMKMIDAGVMGLICPMIDTAADVEKFVGACRFPPRGYRSFGPIRARHYASGDYRSFSDEQVQTFAMIETAAAAANLEEISAVPGLNGLFVGPWDLSLGLGLEPVADFTNGKLLAVLRDVVRVCKQNGLVPGVMASNMETAVMLSGMGFRFVSYTHETGLLEEILRLRLAELRRLIK